MKKRLLAGVFMAAIVSASAALAAGPHPGLSLEDGYGANYQPGVDGGEWGMQPDVFDGTEPPNLPPVQGNTIESVKFEEMPGLNGGFLFIPPDPHCAVGPNHLLTIVNCSIQWYAKTGGPPQNQQPLGKQTAAVTNAFFNSLNPINALFDPKVLWDQYANRFIVIALEQQSSPTQVSRVLLAVSDDADPNGTWYFHAFNAIITVGATTYWFDYPGFAVDQTAIYMTGNYFPFAGGAGIASRLWIMEKAGFYAGGAAVMNPGSPFNAAAASGFPNSTMMPAQMVGTPPPGVGTYLTLYSGLTTAVGAGGLEFLQTIRVDNPLNPVPTFTGDQAALGDIDIDINLALPRGEQPGSINTATRIDTGDRRCLEAIWRNGHLYAVFHVKSPFAPNNTQCSAYWAKMAITTGAGTVVDQGIIGGEDVAPSAWTNYPSIAVDKLGNMAICVGVGNPNMFASAAYTTRSAADVAGFTNPLTVYANGQAFYRRTFSSSTAARNRWGDYSGTVVDPDDCIFWSYHEYAGTQGTPTTVSGVTEDGRWWSRAVSYFVDDNRNGNSDGCEPVAVVLSRFEALRDGKDAIVRWTVAEEHDHLGFNLYRETDAGARIITHVGMLAGRTEYEVRDQDAPEGAAKYWLQEVDRQGRSSWIGSITVDPMSVKPMVAQLLGARPNPFQQATTIEYAIGTARDVNIAVYDIQGRRVTTLFEGAQAAGTHTVTWDGSTDNGPASSGLYFVKLQTAGTIQNVKVMLSRSSTSLN